MSRVGTRAIGRRLLLARAGRGVLGIAVLRIVACSADSDEAGDAGGLQRAGAGLAWSRVDLGFVSAYVLVRGGEAAVVDTGVEGSADKIGSVLDDAGSGWAGVRHVLLSHKHPDHAGSLGEVAARAAAATAVRRCT